MFCAVVLHAHTAFIRCRSTDVYRFLSEQFSLNMGCSHPLQAANAGVLMFTDSYLSSLVWAMAAYIRCKKTNVWLYGYQSTKCTACSWYMHRLPKRNCIFQSLQTISSLVFLRFSCPIPSLENVTCKVVVSNDVTNSLVSLISISKLKTDSSLRFREWKQLQS